MKRPSSSEDGEPANSDNVYSNLQNFLDELEEEDSGEELGQQGGEKKRRLKAEQVRALEKSFEVENKLKPERKAELAQELGLQPRQVAVWFQNRRARWKTKHLEKDYALLKASYESLKHKHTTLLQEKDTILAELNQLKSTRSEEKQRVYTSSIMEETKNPIAETEKKNCVLLSQAKLQKEDRCCSEVIEAGCGLDQMIMTLMSSSTSSSDIGFFDSAQEEFYRHGVAMEAGDDYISSAEESCNFFSDEQPPTFSWYSCDQWN